MKNSFLLLLVLFFLAPVQATELIYSKEELHSRWRSQIDRILSQGKLPLIDMETSYKQEVIERYLPGIFATFDDLGIALVAADGYQAQKDAQKGYRWSDYIIDTVNRYPDRFIPTTNGGTNPNWLSMQSGENSFIKKLEDAVDSGDYAVIGELDFRHYMSNHQCRENKKHRDTNIAINGELGHRVLALSERSGLAVAIHLEVEDEQIEQLDQALEAFPGARVIVAHFGQKRHPYRQEKFTPALVRALFKKHKGLHFDMANGHPNRSYDCSGPNNNQRLTGDNSIWKTDDHGQLPELDEAWQELLEEFSDRFVFATDYGGGRETISDYLVKKVTNFHLQIQGLSEEARHKIAYQNAWRLVTGSDW